MTADYHKGLLTVTGSSNYAPGALMTVSVEDFVTEAPLPYNPITGLYETMIPSGNDLEGRRITISTDEGGAYNSFVE